MKYLQRSTLLLLLAGTPSLAFASDYSGILVFFGVPVMMGALLVYACLAAFPKLHKAIYAVAIIAFIPLAYIGLFAALDGLANIGTHNALDSYIYYALFALVVACFWVMVQRRYSPRGASMQTSVAFKKLFLYAFVPQVAVLMLFLALTLENESNTLPFDILLVFYAPVLFALSELVVLLDYNLTFIHFLFFFPLIGTALYSWLFAAIVTHLRRPRATDTGPVDG